MPGEKDSLTLCFPMRIPHGSRHLLFPPKKGPAAPGVPFSLTPLRLVPERLFA
jgi:hypothetical protein